MSERDLARRATVEQFVRVYTAAEASILSSCGDIAAAIDRINEVAIGAEFREVSFGTRHHSFDWHDPSDAIVGLRRQIWAHLVGRLELKRMMSISKAKELDEWLERHAGDEAVTSDAVLGLFRHHAENLTEMLGEAVGEVYDLLRPRDSSLVTNSEYELGAKVILSRWVESWAHSPSGFHANHYFVDRFRALDNVFSALDGQGSVSSTYYGELADAIHSSPGGRGETRYFRFRACKNGNLHLEFRRPDLVAKFNQIAGGRRLKHDTTARRQPEAAE
jgi:hypothetical protein